MFDSTTALNRIGGEGYWVEIRADWAGRCGDRRGKDGRGRNRGQWREHQRGGESGVRSASDFTLVLRVRVGGGVFGE